MGVTGAQNAPSARESRARRKIREAVEARGYTLTSLTWEPWGRAVEKEGIPGGWEGHVTPEGPYGSPGVMGLSLAEALEWIADFLPPTTAHVGRSVADCASQIPIEPQPS